MRRVSVGAFGLLGLLWCGGAAAADDDIRMNSVGYVPGRTKVATVVTGNSADFSVLRAGDGSVAYQSTLSTQRFDGDTGQDVYLADFSEFDETGEFVLSVDGVGQSPSFRIGDDAYDSVLQTAMLGFYAWRSGVDVSLVHNGQTFAHQAGHLDDALLDFLGNPGVIQDGTGGWYDAGDYGRYIVNASITAGMLLRAWEDFRPQLSAVALAIPEAGGALPDYLDEIRFELEWMLKMQLADGRVCHKLTPIDFAGFVLPADDDLPRYFSRWGSAATAGFVATMAQAARVYEPYDAAFAAQCLSAAQLSYAYLTDNPADVRADLSDFDNAQYQTGDEDDRVWAAAEMWETTGDSSALQDFETRVQNLTTRVSEDWDWGNLRNLGVITYLASTRAGRSASLVTDLEGDVLDAASSLADRSIDQGGYGRAIENYYWGANGSVVRACMLLQAAARLSASERYLDACIQQIAHVLGRNYYNRSWVTGVGLNPPMYPHDRRSSADGITVPYPGYLVGGGWPGATDWEDVEESYETNEIANNWSGAFVYALAGFISTPAAGGAGGAGGSAGAAGSPPAAMGGAFTGGSSGSAGAGGSGGSVASGGSAGTVGAGGAAAVAGTGGAVGVGGLDGVGGAAPLGGDGGTPSSGGGTTAAGGNAPATAGAANSGGTATGEGGTAGSAAGAGPDTVAGSGDEGGCGCRVASGGGRSAMGWAGLGLGLLVLRRRRRR